MAPATYWQTPASTTWSKSIRTLLCGTSCQTGDQKVTGPPGRKKTSLEPGGSVAMSTEVSWTSPPGSRRSPFCRGLRVKGFSQVIHAFFLILCIPVSGRVFWHAFPLRLSPLRQILQKASHPIALLAPVVDEGVPE
jgi:hypothetical protein